MIFINILVDVISYSDDDLMLFVTVIMIKYNQIDSVLIESANLGQGSSVSSYHALNNV